MAARVRYRGRPAGDARPTSSPAQLPSSGRGRGVPPWLFSGEGRVKALVTCGTHALLWNSNETWNARGLEMRARLGKSGAARSDGRRETGARVAPPPGYIAWQPSRARAPTTPGSLFGSAAFLLVSTGVCLPLARECVLSSRRGRAGRKSLLNHLRDRGLSGINPEEGQGVGGTRRVAWFFSTPGLLREGVPSFLGVIKFFSRVFRRREGSGRKSTRCGGKGKIFFLFFFFPYSVI